MNSFLSKLSSTGLGDKLESVSRLALYITLGVAPCIPHSAHAQYPSQSIDLARVTLLGQGIQNSTTQEVAALICAGPPSGPDGAASCDTVRMAVFNFSQKSGNYVGPSYFVGMSPNIINEGGDKDSDTLGDKGNDELNANAHIDHPNEAAIRSITRKLSHNYRQRERFSRRFQNEIIYTYGSFGIFGASGAASIALNSPTPLKVGLALFLLVRILAKFDFLFPSLMSANGREIRVDLTLQEGWNWAAHAKPVTNLQFTHFLRIATDGVNAMDVTARQ